MRVSLTKQLGKAVLAGMASSVALLAVAPVAMAQADESETSAHPFSLPAGPLGDALLAVNEHFGVNIIASEDAVEGKRAPAVFNATTAQDALDRILADTGLETRIADSGNIVIAVKIADAQPASQVVRNTPATDEPLISEIIVVTARKREEDVLDVPISMTVIGAQEIQNSNITELRDYAVRTPNLSFSQNGNRGRTNFQIRGVGENTITGTGAAVGFYLDEFALNPSGSGQIDLGLVEVERIEVLRGPQGTLFGKNTIGGAINVVTRKPDGVFSGRLSASAERFGTYNVNGFINIPLVDDRLAVQVSGFWRESDGFIENVTKGTSLGEGELGGRVAVRAKPTNNLTIDVSALYSKIEADGLLAVTEDDFVAGDLIGRSDAPEFHEDELQVYYGRITYETRWFDAISITGYSDKDRSEGFDGDFGALSFFETLGIEASIETFSQELRLQSNQPDAHLQWTAGVNYADTEATNVFSLATGADWPFDPFGFSRPTSSDLQNIAGFGEANIRLFDPLTLTLGVRYSRDKATQISGEAFSGEWDAWTPKLGLSYDVNEGWLVYGTVSRGYKPGGFDTAISPNDPVLEFEFDSETAWNYEVGVKGTAFDGRLIAEAAVFYLDWKDLQARFSGVFGDDFITNAASARSVGGELQLSLYPTENLFFQTGLGVIDAEFTDFAQSPSGDLTGNAFRYIPNISFNALGEYRRPVANDLEGFIRAEYAYTSEREGDIENTPELRLDAYSILNLRAGLTTDQYELVAYGENVLDERYKSDIDPGGFPTPQLAFPGRPATWGVRGTVRFSK